MKTKLLVMSVILSFSSTKVFAADMHSGVDSIKSFACLSNNSIRAITEIQSIPESEADAGTKRYLFMQESLTVQAEILACSANNKRISLDEARYVISELNNTKDLQIDYLVGEATTIQEQLHSGSLSERNRKSYEVRLVSIVKQIDEIKKQTEILIKRIEKNVSTR